MLSPWSWLWLLLLAPLIALYILKRRRVERRVGSTLLWEAALRDLRAERPWRRLRPYLSLLLQALAIVLGAAALARPAGGLEVPSGAQTVVIVDGSASMLGRDATGRAAIERARELVAELANALPPGAALMVINAGDVPEILSPMTSDGEALQRAKAAIAVRGAHADLQSAIELGSDRLRDAPSGSRILVLSDLAGEGAIEGKGLSAPLQVRPLAGQVGKASDRSNTGIVDFEVRARDHADARDHAEAFVRVAHQGSAPVELYVTIATAPLTGDEPKRTLASRRLRLQPGAIEALSLPIVSTPNAQGAAPFVEARLASVDASKPLRDALELDDRAFSPGIGQSRLPVFLIGEGQLSLERALVADPRVDLFRTTLARIEAQSAEAQGADAEAHGADGGPLDGLVIYAGKTPEAPPSGDCVVVAPEGDRVFDIPLLAPTSSEIVSWDELDASLRFVRLNDVHLPPMRPIAPSAAIPLVQTRAGVALARAERPDGECTLIAFDLDRSDWPRRASFVLFVRNLVERFRERRDAGGLAPGELGDALAIPSRAGQSLEITTPAGLEVSLRAESSLTLFPIEPSVGLFTIRRDEKRLVGIRNLLDASETDLTPRIRFREGELAETEAASSETAPVEMWPWFALALLAILLLETFWATRRGAA